MRIYPAIIVLLASTCTLVPLSTVRAEADYNRAVEGSAVVKEKLFPKSKRFELNIGDVGLILNQSYVGTFLVHNSIQYYPNEIWGFGLEHVFAFNSDKTERQCVETFYNNPDQEPVSECAAVGGEDELATARRANYGPAYVPIRELKQMIIGVASWNPVYGKQLLLLSVTNRFDVFVDLGLGLAFTSSYPLQRQLRSGKNSRGVAPAEGELPFGAKTGEADEDGLLYGPEGRPVAVDETNIALAFGVGQKFFFAKRFHFKVDFRNYTLLGGQAGFDNFFTVWGGFGVLL